MPTYGHKNVHFKEKGDGLESVRLFCHKGRPISVSKPTLNTETESEVTESESSPFPFPPIRLGPSTSLSEIADCSPIPASSPSPDANVHLESVTLLPCRPQVLPSTSLSEIADCSPIPASSPSPYANVHLESVTLLPCLPQVLQGTILVRNIVYEKDVGVRFTFDGWTTVSEVLAAYTGPIAAMETLAGSNQGKTVEEDLVGPSEASGWDRFNFAIRLGDYDPSIWRRTLFLAIRYSAPGVGEFWDNNSGKNYRITFRTCGSPAQPEVRRTGTPSLTPLPISASPAQPEVRRTPSLTPLPISASPASPLLPVPLLMKSPVRYLSSHSEPQTV